MSNPIVHPAAVLSALLLLLTCSMQAQAETQWCQVRGFGAVDNFRPHNDNDVTFSVETVGSSVEACAAPRPSLMDLPSGGAPVSWAHTVSISRGEPVPQPFGLGYGIEWRWRIKADPSLFHRVLYAHIHFEMPDGHVSNSMFVAIWQTVFLDIATTQLKPATYLQPYEFEVQAKGGTGNYTWAISGLPPGFYSDGATIRSDRVTAPIGTYPVRVELYDDHHLQGGFSGPVTRVFQLQVSGCGATFSHHFVTLTWEGRGGSVELDLINTTDNSCDFILGSESPPSSSLPWATVPLTFDDQSGQVSVGVAAWRVPAKQQRHIALQISGASNTFCQQAFALLYMWISPFVGESPLPVTVAWEPRQDYVRDPSTGLPLFDPTTGLPLCRPAKTISQHPPKSFGNVSFFHPSGSGRR